MTIYIDIVLLENLCMNYAILFGTGLALKAQIKIARLLVSSLIGSIYAVCAFMEIIPLYSNIFFKIVLSLVMVYVCFSPRNIKQLAKQVTVFYLVSFVFGGTAFAILYFIKPENIISKNGLLVGIYPIQVALSGAVVALILLQITFRIIKTKLSKKDMVCEIEIFLKERSKRIITMIDTGNFLKEPITGIPVVIVEAKELTDFLPENILENVDRIIQGEVETIENIYDFKFRVIPFTSLGTQNGLLLGLQIDQVIIHTKEEAIGAKDIIVGICEQSLSKQETYHALIGLDLLERSTNEFFRNVKI